VVARSLSQARRSLSGRFLVGLVLLYALVSLTLGGTRAARPTFATAATTWFLVLLPARTRHPLPRRPRLRNLERLLGLLALALVLLELSLRARAAGRGETPQIRSSLRANRLVPGHDYGAGLRGNRLGYPGTEFRRERRPGVRRIAALGNSFAVGPTVPFADNYLRLLEKAQPATEVYNFGVSGTGPREYAHILREDVWPFQPDLILVSLFVTHDVTETLPGPRYLDPRQHSLYWLLAGDGRGRPQPDQADLPSAIGNTSSECGPAARLTEGTLSTAAFHELEAQRLRVCQTPSPAGLEKKWHRTLHDLRRLVADCSARQVPVAFVLIPDEAQVDPEVLADLFRSGALDSRTFDRDRPQRRFRDFCAAACVPCLDLLPAFQGRTDLYAPRNTHWNVAGNRLAAARLAEWLAGQTGLHRPGPAGG
jgi:hypothetical protein